MDLLCISLRWRHNDYAGVSNHQPHVCLLNRLFRRTSKKTSKLRVTDLCAGNSPGTGEFPAQMASYAENVSIWWRHHVMKYAVFYCVFVLFGWYYRFCVNSWGPSTHTMMTSSNWNIFRVNGPLWGESTGHRWIPFTKTSDAELWCSLWSAPEQTVEQTIETTVIWNAIALIMTSLHGFGISETVIIFFTATRQLSGQPVTKNWSNWHLRTRPISSVPLISFFFFGRKLKHCSYIEHHIHIWQAVEYEYNSKNVIYAFVNAYLSIPENLARMFGNPKPSMQMCNIMTSSNGNIFRGSGPSHRSQPVISGFPSDTELLCFLWSVPEPTVEQQIETPVIWDALRSLWVGVAKRWWLPCTTSKRVNEIDQSNKGQSPLV